MSRFFQLHDRHLYLCTPDRPDLTQFIAACVRGGVDVVQLRDKHLDARPLMRRARLAQEVCADLGVPFIINDRPDIALEIGSDGIHVGQDDVSVDLVRRLLGSGPMVGLSTHDATELLGSLEEEVDYISAGPIVATPTKPGRPGTGITYAALAIQSSEVPVFITGGVTPEAVATLAGVGARHFVVVRYLTESPNPMAAAAKLRLAIDEVLS